MERQMCSLERITWKIAKQTPTSFAIMARIVGELNEEQIKQALLKIRKKYPLSAVKVVERYDGQVFFSTKDVPPYPIRILQRNGIDDWVNVVQQEMAKPFDWEIGPLMRFVWLYSSNISEIIIVCHHCVADGLSVINILNDLMLFLSSRDLAVEQMPFLPQMDALIAGDAKKNLSAILQVGSMRLGLQLLKLWKRSGLSFTRGKIRSQGNLKNSNYCLLPWTLTQEETRNLIEATHREKTTVHAAITTALLRAYAEEVKGKNKWYKTVSSPVNFRPNLNTLLIGQFGLFVKSVEVSVDCAPNKPFWAVSREIKKKFNSKVISPTFFHDLLAINSIPPILDNVAVNRLLTRNNLTYDVSVSNLGLLNLREQYGYLRLEAVYGPCVNGFELEQVLGVATQAGKLTFSFVYRDSVMNLESANKIKSKILNQLIQVSS